MATRSRIGLLIGDESVVSVYHHWDGYPQWLGVHLRQNYTTKEKISELLDKAIENSLENGYRTKDIMQDNCNLLSTSEMGEVVAKEFRNLLIKYEK